MDNWDNKVPNSANEGSAAADIEEKVKKGRMELFDWVSCFVVAILVVVLIFVFVGRTIDVDGRSMLQTLHHSDRVIMSNLLYTPRNGDIIVFSSPVEQFDGISLVKRIIATAGQTIDMDFYTGNVFIDGNLLYEPYINVPTTDRYDFVGPMQIPYGYVFVMGDNRGNSTDSRDSILGLVDTRHILGRVHFILFPGIDDFGHRDFSRIGLIN